LPPACNLPMMAAPQPEALVIDILLTHTPEMRALRYGDEALAGLRALGRVRLHEGDEPLDTQGLIGAAKGCRVIVADRLTPGEAALFEARPELVAFVRCAVDTRNIDLEAASGAGVLVTRAGPGFVAAVVELLLGQMIDLARGLSGYVHAYREGRIPTPVEGIQLAGRTAGIIGYGNLGRRLAEVVQALGMEVVVHDPHADPSPYESLDRDSLLARADFVVCVPLHTPETTRMIDEAFLRRMKPDAFLVHPSRGAVADEDALLRALTEGWIRGAALDVGTEPDDVPPVRLGRLPNVVAAPHIGGLVPEATRSQALDTVEQVRAILEDREPPHALNHEHATRLADPAR
jgi:D-3-phosphoglycerate dehydrogenase / 2-oxoglutarate reductase